MCPAGLCWCAEIPRAQCGPSAEIPGDPWLTPCPANCGPAVAEHAAALQGPRHTHAGDVMLLCASMSRDERPGVGASHSTMHGAWSAAAGCTIRHGIMCYPLSSSVRAHSKPRCPAV
jgi:hypothetical protein